MQIVDTVTAQLRADATQFTRGFDQAAQSVDRFNAKAPTASRVAGVFQRGLSNLAFQAAGVPGPIGKITEAMLAFAGGSALVIGVAAGLGLIVKGFDLLTRGAREAAKATQELIDTQLKLRQGERSQEIRGTENLAALQVALTQARTAHNAAKQAVEDARAATRGPGTREPDLAGAIEREEEARKKLTNALMAYNRQVRELKGIETGLAREERLKKEAEVLAEIVEDLQDVTREATRAGEAIQSHLIPGFEGLNAAEIKASIEALKLPKIDMSGEKPSALKDVTASIRGELRKVVGDDKAQREIVNIGETMGDLLAQGVMGGFQDAASAMRAIFFAVLRFALGQISGGIFGSVNPAKAAAAKAEGIGDGILQGAMVGPELNVSMPAPMTPFDIARDAQWQRALRESLAVAKSQGFR